MTMIMTTAIRTKVAISNTKVATDTATAMVTDMVTDMDMDMESKNCKKVLPMKQTSLKQISKRKRIKISMLPQLIFIFLEIFF